MRYLTKGELLEVLGPDADSFTAFMMDPAAFSISGDDLYRLRIAKQKFDWTGGIDLDRAEIQSLISLLIAAGVLSDGTKRQLDTVADRADLDSFLVQILALDDVTIENQTGAIQDGEFWRVEAVFKNLTKGTDSSEAFVFDRLPTLAEVNEQLSAHVKKLRTARG